MPYLAGLAKPPHILVVDDSEEDRVMLRRYLTRDERPCEVHESASIAEALAHVSQHTPDCVLMDFNLTDGDGLALLSRLVGTYGSHAFGLIMLTASGHTGVAVEALKCGAHDYIEKSGLTSAALRRIVGSAIEKATYQRELALQRSKLAEKNDELAARLGQLDREIDERNRAQTALGKSEAFLQSIMAANGDCMKVLSIDGDIEWMNDNGMVMMEVPDFKKIHLTRWMDYFKTAESHRQASEAVETARAGGVGRFSAMCATLRGSEKWWDVLVTPIFNAEGRPERLLSVSRDITQAKRQEETVRAAERQLRVVTDHLPVYVARFDRDMRCLFANRMLARRFHYQPEEIVGKPWSEIVGQEARDALQPHVDIVLGGRVHEFESAGNGDATGRWLSVTFVPERSDTGVVTGFVAVSADITQSKQATADLEKARDQALEASQARDIFLAALSHELRTPLNPVLLIASEAVDNAGLPPAVRADFASIANHIELEARLIDDLLDLSRISHGKLPVDLHTIALYPVLKDAIDIIRAEITAKKIDLRVELGRPDHFIEGDAVRLQQVLWNLLKNAVKFTPVGGMIGVRCRTGENANTVVIEVEDTGIGIAAEDMPRIFQAFSQGSHMQDGRAIRMGGLGLGLAISRMLVELHEGQIRAESKGPGRGTKFTITLPLSRAQSEPVSPLPANKVRLVENAPGAEQTILLVEDHEGTRDTMISLLKKRGFTVLTASSLEEAMRIAEAESFDLLVSDIGLPDGDGYMLMHRLLENRPQIKAIALSGYGTEEDIERSRQAGFSEHITKPVRIDMLMSALARLTGENDTGPGKAD